VADFFLDIYGKNAVLLKPLFRFIHYLEARTWQKLDLILTKVEYTRKFLSEAGVPMEKTAALYNPCDLGLYRPMDRAKARSKLNIPGDAMVIVHHGVLHPNKVNGRIIKALSEIKQEAPEIHYLLIGSGPEMESLKKTARETGMEENVTFTGWIETEEDVCEAINAADVGLVMRIGHESDNYHVTNTLVHEMACGLPIISANLAGVAEIIKDGESGLLFEPGDMEEFKSKLMRLIKEPSLCESYGNTSLELARKLFDKDIIAEKTVALILRTAE
jgi:glycosyltransferase involved in cell wall biosynthesis